MGTVRLAGGEAAYGMASYPVEEIVDQLAAGVDYVVCDGLAEATLVVLQKDRQRDETLGYCRDVGNYVRTMMPAIQDGKTKWITNSGGLNPIEASREVVRILREAGVSGVKVATVVGDDILPYREQLGLDNKVLFARAYLGARPIVSALEQGADIVITGRLADASLFLGPLVYEHGWSWDDWSKMAAGVAIGHILECSAQASGSVYSGPWWEDPDPGRPGYPIGEVSEDGSVVISKPDHTGGVVNFDTVREQLLYEVHDPRAYLNPDCTADFTSLSVVDLGDNSVRVSGARGGPPPETYLALAGRSAGWAGDAIRVHAWPDAEARARKAHSVFRERVARGGIEVEEWLEEYFGAGALHGDAASEDLTVARGAGWEPPEVVARLAWRCKDADTVQKVREIGSGGQGAGGQGSSLGRPKRRTPTELVALEALAVARSLVDAGVRVSVDDV